jgi:hypothetical protein
MQRKDAENGTEMAKQIDLVSIVEPHSLDPGHASPDFQKLYRKYVVENNMWELVQRHEAVKYAAARENASERNCSYTPRVGPRVGPRGKEWDKRLDRHLHGLYHETLYPTHTI